MSAAWRGMDKDQIEVLNNYINQLGPYLMEGFSSVPRSDNTIVWDEVNHILKGHLRSSIFTSIMETVDKLCTTQKLQGKVRELDEL